MSRRGAAVLAAALVVAGACGGGGDDDDDRATPTSSTTAGVSSTTTAGEVTSTTAATTATTTGRARSGTTTSTAATTATTAAASPAAAGSAFTTPGTYRYTTTGNYTAGLSPSQARNGETTFTVDPPSGSEQRSVRLGLGRTTEQVVRLEAGGAYLVSLRQTEQGLTKEVRPTSAALVVPVDAAPGRSWSWKAMSTDGLTTVDSSFKVVRTEDLTVGGQRVPTLVVEAVVTLGGDVTSTARQTSWISPEHRLIIQAEDFTQGRVGLVNFASRSKDVLASLQPG